MRSNGSGNMGFVLNQTTLGTELRKARGHRSLREISQETGVSIATLSRIESDLIGLPSRETLAALSNSYGLPLEMMAQLVYCGAPPPAVSLAQPA